MSADVKGKTLPIDAAGFGVAALLSVGAWMMVVQPVMHSRDRVQSTATNIAKRDAELREAGAAKTEAEKLSIKLRHELASSVTLMPVSRLNERLAALSQLCDSMGVTVEQLTPSAPEAGKQYTTVKLKLAGTGQATSIVALLQALAREYRDTAVTGFRIAGDPTGQTPTSGYAIDLAWYAVPAGLAGAQ